MLFATCLHIDDGQAESPKVVALEHCAAPLWDACADAISAWSAVLVLTEPGRVRVRVEYVEGASNAADPTEAGIRIQIGRKAVAKEFIMRSIAVALRFDASVAPFDWIDREFPGAGVYVKGTVYSGQLAGRIMSEKLVPGAVLSASTVEAVRRAQNAESSVCIDAGDCRDGFKCIERGGDVPNECRRSSTEGVSVAVIALIAVWSGLAALIVAI